MSKRKSRLSSLDFIIMASCYSAKGDMKKALTALTAANNCEDFDTTIANDASLDVEFEELAEDSVGLSQTAIDELEDLDFESDGEETAATEESEEVSESDDSQFEISNKTREKIKAGNEESESEVETEETEDSDDLETAGFGDKYAEILAQLETESDSEEEEEEEEQETASPKISRAERNLSRLKKS